MTTRLSLARYPTFLTLIIRIPSTCWMSVSTGKTSLSYLTLSGTTSSPTSRSRPMRVRIRQSLKLPFRQMGCLILRISSSGLLWVLTTRRRRYIVRGMWSSSGIRWTNYWLSNCPNWTGSLAIMPSHLNYWKLRGNIHAFSIFTSQRTSASN